MDYKFTLNLPQTKFPMKASLPKIEPNILEEWYFNSVYESSKSKKTFILNDGPPYANGQIHIGHAFNKILKDFVCKFKFLCGYKIYFMPGWDCHGLPIELKIEKKLQDKNINFRYLCKEYAETQIKLQMDSFIRLGVFGNWLVPYKTMDYLFEVSILKSFIKMLEKKYIYLGFKPNYWCFDCESALAEAEVEYKNKQSDSVYLFLEISNLHHITNKFRFKKIGFIVWTTTPWTLPFNEALALNEKFTYVVIGINDIAYILCESLLLSTFKKMNITDYIIFDSFKGSYFTNIKVKHPIYEKEVSVVFSDHVNNESGTGCVHIAPAYGYDDYKVALKYNLLIKNHINEKGFFYKNISFFENQYYLDSINLIFEKLKEKDSLLFSEILVHRYPHCWRHSTPLIFRTTRQWFLNVTKKEIKNKLFYLIEKFISWTPLYGEIKMKTMFKDRLDWCISRQRYWGVPIMLFIDHNGIIHPETINILHQSLNFIKKYGTEFWYKFDVFKIFNIDKKKYIQIIDVLDVWFDSSSSYRFLYDNYDIIPPYDLCIEGSDQYRGWFQVSIINALFTLSTIPWKKIISHGFILDHKGRKMSKSLNNVISPDNIINKYGADVLRLWVCSTNYTTDVNISDEILERICDSYRKIRNTFKFILSNINDITHKKTLLSKSYILNFDLWILFCTYKLKLEILRDYQKNSYHNIYKKVYNFCVEELGSKYIDIIKDRLYTVHRDARARKSAQLVFYYIIYNLLKMLAPVLSFTTEEAWNYLLFKDNKSVFKSLLNTDFFIFKLLNKINIFNQIIWHKLFTLKNELNRNIEENRKNNKIGTSLELHLKIICNIYWYDMLNTIKKELHLFFQVSKIELILVLSKKNQNEIKYKINKTKNVKCERCWHRILSYVLLRICSRCINNLYYKNETRKFF